MYNGEGLYTFVKEKKISFPRSTLNKLILDFIETGHVCPDLQNQFLVDDVGEAQTTPWDLLEKWRKELIKTLILRHTPDSKSLLQKSFETLTRYPFWEGCQLLSAYRALVGQFLGTQILPDMFHQTDGGAAALEIEGMWRWGDIPHLHMHAELGVIWALLGLGLNTTVFSTAALKLAKWQLNTLDFDFRPFQGLFVQEADANLNDLLILNYLLFRATGLISGDKKLLYAAYKQLSFLTQCENVETKLSSYALILDSWFESISGIREVEPFFLSSDIYEPSTCLMGKRTKDYTILSTLFGGGTGMGSLRAGQIRVLSYGPQWLPLGDCSGFGFEGGILSHQCAPFHMHNNKSSFTQSRLVRLASTNPQLDSHANFKNGKPSEIWMKAKQHFDQQLTIETSYIGLQNEMALAFVFFIEGEKCQIGEKKELYPRTFSRYEGSSQPIVISSDTSSLALISPSNESTMQVIPLAGGKNFWGADFLVAYTIDQLHHPYSWKLQFETA